MDNKKKIMALVLATSAGTGAVLLQDGNIAHADNLNKQSMQSERIASTGEVVNISSCLRVRSKASTSSEIVGYLHNKDKVNIQGKEGSFYKINFSGKTGYVHEDYIKVGSSSSNDIASSGKGKVINITSSLRIRSGASTNTSTIGYLYEGNTFDIIGKSGDWYKIKTNGKTGYIYGEYVEVLGSNNNGNNNNNNDNSNNGKMGQVKNVTSSLRIRSGAGTNHSVVGYLSNGDKFKILEKSGSWYKINGNGNVGYVHSDYVNVLGEDSGNNSNNGGETNEKSTGKVINITSNLRIRNAPNTTSSVVGYLLNGQTFNITGKSGSFYKINHNGTVGYVHQDYVQVIGEGNTGGNDNGSNSNNNGGTAINKNGRLVNVSTSLRLRNEPSTNSSVVGYLVPGETFKVISKHGDWYKVSSNGKTGYASAEYIKIVDGNDDNTSNSASFEAVFNILKAQVGSPYIWGGKGELITTDSLRMFKNMYPSEAAEGKYNIPSKYINNGYRAFDCSGLLYWGFRQVGINIGGSTYSQINAGREVSVNDARPGDLLFYGSLEHVGMYIGNGQWIQAPKSHDYVKISNVPWSRIGRARRVLN